MVDALVNERCFFELVRIFHPKEEEKCLKCYSFVLILDHLEGEK